MKNNPLRRVRDARARALKDGSAAAEDMRVDFRSELSADGDTFEVWVYDMIDDWFGITASDVVYALAQAGGRNVLFHLNSPGGLVTEALAIHATIRGYSGRTEMRVEGMAASAASFLMLAADEVTVEPNAMVMIHDAWGYSVGPAEEHRKQADVLDMLSDNIAGMYAAKADGTAEEWRARMVEETWYVGQAAVDAGLADSVRGESAPAEDSASARWSGVYASAPKQTGGKVTISFPALGDPAPYIGPIDKLHRAAMALPDPVEPPAEDLPEPIDWSALRNGLKGLTR